ncbi:MAG: hypothetical protein ACT4QD_06725 [Acidobacteriota bacterium]
MRSLFTILWLFGVPTLWLVGSWWLLRTPQSGVVGPLPQGSLQVGAAVFAAAVIAFAFVFSQRTDPSRQLELEAARDRARILDEQRLALESSRQVLEQALAASEQTRQAQADLLAEAEKSREALQAAAEVAKQQQQAPPPRASERTERPRPAARPRLEFHVGDVEWASLEKGVAARLARADGKVIAELVVRNMGDVALKRPTLQVRALPSRVTVVPAEFPARASHELAPAKEVGGGYVYAVTASVPEDVTTFVLLVVISGDNFPRQTVKIPIDILRG